MKIIGLGDNVVDVYLDQDKMYPGGNSVNVTVLAKRAGAVKAGYIGIIGNDISGDLIKNSLFAEGVDTSHIRVMHGANGRNAIKLTQGDNDRTFVGSNLGGEVIKAKLNLIAADIDYIQQYNVMHTSVHSEIGYLLPLLKDKLMISMDFSDGYTDERIKTLCPYLDVAFFSCGGQKQSHIDELLGKALSSGAKLVIATMGLGGSIITDGTTVHHQPAFNADIVVDTLGAGDTYIAAFLVEFYKSKDFKKAAKRGAEYALECLKYYGAFGYGIDADHSGLQMIWPHNQNID